MNMNTAQFVPGFYKNNENLIPFKFYNLQEIVANRASKQLWGNGFIFDSESEKIKEAIENIKQWNDLFSLFYEAEKVFSVWGVVIFEIVKTKEGVFFINIAQPYAISRVARIIQTEIQAEVWIRYVYDDMSFFIQTTYTKNEIVREIKNIDGVVLTGAQKDRLKKVFQLKEREVHNLGFIPVIFAQNLPKKNFFGGSNIGSYYPDATPVIELQSLLDETLSTIKWELQANKTRIFGQLSQIEMSRLQNTNNLQIDPDVSFFLKKVWVQADMGVETSGRSIEILMADPKFEKYILMLDWIVDAYYRGCGYSRGEDGSKQQTAFELAVQQSDDIETTRIKRTLRQHQYKRLFKKLFIWMGIGENEILNDELFTFEIKENIIMDEIKKIDIAEKKILAGLSSRVREIMKINGVSKEEAEQIKIEIDKEQNDDTLSNIQLERKYNNERAEQENTENNDKERL